MAAPERPNHHVNVDELARDKVQEINNSLNSVGELKSTDFDSWFTLLRQIITAADLHRTNDKNDNQNSTKTKQDGGESIYAYYGDDDEQFNAVDPSEQFATYSVKWTIRVKAFELVHKLVNIQAGPPNQLICKTLDRHLSDLIRLSFVAATSPYDDLKLQGFHMFELLISKFAFREERQFPGHSVLEQFKVQIMSALRPAFQLDSPPYITAIASRICSLWIGMGLEKDPIELKRIYHNMMSMTVEKLENQSINQNSKLYTESELEQERIDILGSWAYLYSVANKTYPFRDSFEAKLATPVGKVDHELLETLIQPQISSLIDKWWEALKDYALLILPVSKIVGTIHNSEHVYTKDIALKLFDKVWYKILVAATIWLVSDRREKDHGKDTNGLSESSSVHDVETDGQPEVDKSKYFKFVCGILMREFCNCQSKKSEVLPYVMPESTSYAAKSLLLLISHQDMKYYMTEDLSIAEEFYKIIYNILVTHEQIFKTQQYVNMKYLLDSIFSIIVIKVCAKPQAAKYGIATLLESIETSILDISAETGDVSSSSQECSLPQSAHLKISNVLILIKNNTTDILEDIDLLSNLVTTFQRLLKLRLSPIFGTRILECIRDFHHLLDLDNRSQVALDILFDSRLIIISELIRFMKLDKPNDIGQAYQKSVLDRFIDFIKHDIHSSDIDHQTQQLEKLTKTLLALLSDAPINGSNATNRIANSDLTKLCLKYLNQIKVEQGDKFFDALSCDTKLLYNQVMRAQDDKKAKHDAKLISQLAAQKSSANVRPKSKIVLKADFSNFYNK